MIAMFAAQGCHRQFRFSLPSARCTAVVRVSAVMQEAVIVIRYWVVCNV